MGIFWTTFTIRSLLQEKAKCCLEGANSRSCGLVLRRCKLVGLAYLWGRWFPWRINASEVLSSGFTAMEHLSWESVRRPQASTYISTQVLTQSNTLRGDFLGAFLFTCKAGLVCACRVCLSVSLASLDAPYVPQPCISPIIWTLQS